MVRVVFRKGEKGRGMDYSIDNPWLECSVSIVCVCECVLDGMMEL